MSTFNQLRICNTHIDGKNARIIEFEISQHLKNQYAFKAGQNISIRLQQNDEEFIRNYSICESENSKKLRIGVRKVPDGIVSTWLFNNATNGLELEVLPPSGVFKLHQNTATKHHWFFAAGSGITPTISLLTTLLENDPTAQVTLFYANQKFATTMFVEELEDLKNRFLARFDLHFIFSREQQMIEWQYGRLDSDKLAQLNSLSLLTPESDDIAYICGPNNMIQTTVESLLNLGMQRANIKFESFGQLETKTVDFETTKRLQKDKVEVLVKLQGRYTNLEFSGQDNILDLGLDNGLKLPYACHAGVCGTCRCKLIKGEVEMENNLALDDWEVEQNIILSCQATPKESVQKIEVDYDII